jgi:hypothetical protein
MPQNTLTDGSNDEGTDVSKLMVSLINGLATATYKHFTVRVHSGNQQRSFEHKRVLAGELLHDIKPLKKKGNLFYLKTQFIPRRKHSASRLQKPIS